MMTLPKNGFWETTLIDFAVLLLLCYSQIPKLVPESVVIILIIVVKRSKASCDWVGMFQAVCHAKVNDCHSRLAIIIIVWIRHHDVSWMQIIVSDAAFSEGFGRFFHRVFQRFFLFLCV